MKTNDQINLEQAIRIIDWYADPANYIKQTGGIGGWNKSNAQADGGARARGIIPVDGKER